MATNNQNLVPSAKEALNRMKYEVASQVGVNLQQGYNGNITAREAGKIGGNIVKQLITQAERNLGGGTL